MCEGLLSDLDSYRIFFRHPGSHWQHKHYIDIDLIRDKGRYPSPTGGVDNLSEPSRRSWRSAPAVRSVSLCLFDTSRIQPFGLFPVDPLGVFVCKTLPGRRCVASSRHRDRSPTPVRSKRAVLGCATLRLAHGSAKPPGAKPLRAAPAFRVRWPKDPSRVCWLRFFVAPRICWELSP